MRRLWFLCLLGGVLVGVFSTPAAAAKRATEDSAVQGTYAYHDKNVAIVVGYICPGDTSWFGTDPHAQYWAQVTEHGRDGGTYEVTRHAAWKLDQTLYELSGVNLSEEAWQVLADDAATIDCT